MTATVEARRGIPVLDRTHPLAEAAAAIRHMLGGEARGELVVSLSPAACGHHP